MSPPIEPKQSIRGRSAPSVSESHGVTLPGSACPGAAQRPAGRDHGVRTARANAAPEPAGRRPWPAGPRAPEPS